MKHIPMKKMRRMRRELPKAELIRIVRSPEGEISLDFRGKKNAAAYIYVRARRV